MSNRDIKEFQIRIERQSDIGQNSKALGSDAMSKDGDKSKQNLDHYDTFEEEDLQSLENLDLRNFGIDDKAELDIEKELRSKREVDSFVANEFLNKSIRQSGSEYGDFDFSEKEPLTSVDPYNPSPELIKSMLAFDNKNTNSASIIIDVYRQKLLELANSDLSKSDMEIQEKLLKICDFMEEMRVIDGKVLQKLYEIYKFKAY